MSDIAKGVDTAKQPDGRKRSIGAADVLLIAIVAFLIAFFLAAFHVATTSAHLGNSAIVETLGSVGVRRLLAYWVGTAVVVVLFLSDLASPMRRFLFRYRWVLGGLAIILCVLFKLSGSSIASWSDLIGGESFRDTLFGIPRDVRSDEYIVNTPFAFSQEYTGYAAKSSLLRGYTTDVTLTYAQPCWSLSTLFRPFLWGYLFLGSERGLSLFWSARLVILFLVSIEMGLLVTERRKGVASAYALLVCFSPVVQWWFAVNGIAELFIFGQGLVLLLHRFLRTDSVAMRWSVSLAMAYSMVAFLLVVYPAWQVPLFWVFLCLGIGDFISYLHECCRCSAGASSTCSLRRLATPALCIVVLTCVAAAVVFIPVMGVVSEQISTVYPGQRVDNGGSCDASWFFMGLSALLNPVNAPLVSPNSCESTAFFFLSPLGLVAAVVCCVVRIARGKGVECTIVVLALVELLLMAYAVLGFPSLLAKITLMSHSTAFRTAQVVGFADLLLLMKVYALMSDEKALASVRQEDPWWAKAVLWLVAGLLAFLLASKCPLQTTEPMEACYRLVLFAIVFVALAVILGCATGKLGSRYGLLLVSAFVAVSGFCVNPVQRGASPLVGSDAYAAIQEVTSSDSDAKWAAAYGPLGQLCVSAGASCISSVNTYPVLERWAMLDEDGTSEDIYNRYAYITIIPTEESTTFEYGVTGDAFTVNLNIDDFATLGVDYFVSYDAKLEDLQSANTSLDLVGQGGAIYIYRVISAD